ncbi:MAG: hypothetical protein AVDCRST_MAG88-4346 [uncultured Thermomicrobiales bacterium]|uniref:DUF7482 domain-containing protein n=1 Tax=uncultured Thermomicrobiales bacterium TaxID=1645740 RepID=A0A6J4VWV1_9BACT|nr:MAG: hypothetical protein AVDCRST_MAG88-4346 [uncultured Thermomicrobiales bacterium]
MTFTFTLTSRRIIALLGFLNITLVATLLFTSVKPSLADQPDPLPPPPSVGTNIPASYFGPMPSEVQKELVGPVELLRAGQVDEEAFTVTLPLYRGQLGDGRAVWYILTDTTDRGNAEALGLNWSPKLVYAAVGRAVRSARLGQDGTLTFGGGAVDFSPARALTPGDAPNFFPPKAAQPGSVGDAAYTPLIRIENAGGHIYNAPVVAFGSDANQLRFCDGNPDYSLVHDRVTKICAEGNGGGTVTLKMTPIFSFAKPASYISTEASDPMVATLDRGTHAPALADIKVGNDDGAFSAIERLFVIANGPTGAGNPQRQGLNSALSDLDEKGMPAPPLHVIGGIPTVALDYSPLWDLNLGAWTQEAIDRGYRSRLIDEFQLLSVVQKGHITRPGGGQFGSTGIVVNCPIIMRFL